MATFNSGIGDLCSITADPAANRWYFHYEGYSGEFDFGADENIGYASATFLAPTAAPTQISGRVTSNLGRGLSGVVIKAVGTDGKVTSNITNTFGYYTLSNLIATDTYIVSVDSRRYSFPNGTLVLSPDTDLTNIDFQAR